MNIQPKLPHCFYPFCSDSHSYGLEILTKTPKDPQLTNCMVHVIVNSSPINPHNPKDSIRKTPCICKVPTRKGPKIVVG